MTRYTVTGIPLSPPSPVLDGYRVGDTLDLDLDESAARELVGAGALRVEEAGEQPAPTTTPSPAPPAPAPPPAQPPATPSPEPPAPTPPPAAAG